MAGKKKDPYKEYLASMHGKLVTPDEVIADIVQEGTNKDVKAKFRIIAGEVNEVYDITLADGTHVILRISKHKADFLQEKWAIKKVEKLGVPVPKILLIQHFKVGTEDKSACLMEKIDGEPLERGNINFDKLDLELRRKLINEAGKILSKIHSIKTEGFGWIIGEGKSEFKTSDDLINRLMEKRDEFLQMAEEEDLDRVNIRKALDVVDSFRKAYSKITPSLNHGDYSHKHFMVKDEKIVAILDWGGVRSDSSVYDFARWDYWFGDYIPTDWLKEGYTDKSLFDNNFEDLLHLLRLTGGLEIMNWYHKEKYQPAIDKAKKRLLKDLEYFK